MKWEHMNLNKVSSRDWGLQLAIEFESCELNRKSQITDCRYECENTVNEILRNSRIDRGYMEVSLGVVFRKGWVQWHKVIPTLHHIAD